MDNPKVQEILEKQVLTVVMAVEEKIDDEIAVSDRLDLDDLEVLREQNLQQKKKMAQKKSRWITLGHGEYSKIPNEEEIFSVVKASERVLLFFPQKLALQAAASPYATTTIALLSGHRRHHPLREFCSCCDGILGHSFQ